MMPKLSFEHQDNDALGFSGTHSIVVLDQTGLCFYGEEF